MFKGRQTAVASGSKQATVSALEKFRKPAVVGRDGEENNDSNGMRASRSVTAQPKPDEGKFAAKTKWLITRWGVRITLISIFPLSY